ncbi:ribose import binding protein RbsB [Kordia sp. SMS9]|uniref:substrate-binding domain-containing protein n=1 Tax=Kordia sp. SMS9 TaxID=2282170 RepID=UPI000E0D736F|nr:substrate-binding domain-containing protein [Kordia sp. SMS9]AXG68665.1 ribose import binding protein RbsB [Kordia sp. SMS9]
MNKTVSNLIIGIISSLIATILLTFFSSKFVSYSFEIPVWFLVVLILILTFTITLIAVYFIKRPKNVFLLLSQSIHKPFFGILTDNIIIELESRNINVIVMPPLRSLSVESQHKWLSKILNEKSLYSAGFMVANVDPDRKKVFKNFCKKFKKPIIFLDSQPPFDLRDYNDKSIFVGVDHSFGGEMAAKGMIYEFEKLRKKTFNVLVIATRIVPERQNSFKEYFDKNKTKVNVKVIDTGDFSRESGRNIYKQFLVDNNPLDYQGIFCTNDEMALGVLECINEFKNFPKDKVILIGYDGIEEAISTINNLETPFKNTVSQDTKKLSEIAVEKFINIKSSNFSKSKHLIRPKLYKSIE